MLALVCSVVGLVLFPFFTSRYKGNLSVGISPLGQFLFWGFVGVFVVLTWVGMCPVEVPFTMVGQLSTLLYFSFFVGYPLVMSW